MSYYYIKDRYAQKSIHHKPEKTVKKGGGIMWKKKLQEKLEKSKGRHRKANTTPSKVDNRTTVRTVAVHSHANSENRVNTFEQDTQYNPLPFWCLCSEAIFLGHLRRINI